MAVMNNAVSWVQPSGLVCWTHDCACVLASSGVLGPKVSRRGHWQGCFGVGVSLALADRPG